MTSWTSTRRPASPARQKPRRRLHDRLKSPASASADVVCRRGFDRRAGVAGSAQGGSAGMKMSEKAGLPFWVAHPAWARGRLVPLARRCREGFAPYRPGGGEVCVSAVRCAAHEAPAVGQAELSCRPGRFLPENWPGCPFLDGTKSTRAAFSGHHGRTDSPARLVRYRPADRRCAMRGGAQLQAVAAARPRRLFSFPRR